MFGHNSQKLNVDETAVYLHTWTLTRKCLKSCEQGQVLTILSLLYMTRMSSKSPKKWQPNLLVDKCRICYHVKHFGATACYSCRSASDVVESVFNLLYKMSGLFSNAQSKMERNINLV